jgi:hypothetical protein
MPRKKSKVSRKRKGTKNYTVQEARTADEARAARKAQLLLVQQEEKRQLEQPREVDLTVDPTADLAATKAQLAAADYLTLRVFREDALFAEVARVDLNLRRAIEAHEAATTKVRREH